MSERLAPHPAPKREYTSIQCLRAMAALAVVLFHLQPFEAKYLTGPHIAPRVFALGDIGVDLFFVISGFIIVTSTRGWFVRPHRAVQFIWRRATRIYPIYWVYYVMLLAADLTMPNVFSNQRGKPDLLASFFLYPSHGSPLLLVSWTLVFELQFYLLFALALWKIREKFVLPALLIWAAMIMLRHSLVQSSWGLLNIPFDLLNLDFIAGCLVALLIGGVRRSVAGWLGLSGLLLVCGGCIIFLEPNGTIEKGWASVVTCGVGFALVLAGCVRWETTLSLFIPRFVLAIGDSSYSLYLSHLLTCAVVGRVWSKLPVENSSLINCVALASALLTSTVVGWLSFQLIELPLLRLLRRLASARAVAAA